MHFFFAFQLIRFDCFSGKICIQSSLKSKDKCPSEGHFFCQAHLYIDANNAGMGLPLPGNRTGGCQVCVEGMLCDE